MNINTNKIKSSFLILPILFLASYVVWLFCFRGFIFGELTITSDAISYYEHTKYFIEHLARGTYPLWDPFFNGGVPNEFFLRRINGFNPFYIVLVLFYKAGIPFTTSYLLYLSLYYFLGVFGFFKIAKLIFQRTEFAFFAFLLLYFSSLSTRIFDSFIILEFVPYVWCFYFFLSFSKSPKRLSLLGFSFSLMMILTIYIPFYFLIIFGLFLMTVVAFYPSMVANRTKSVFEFLLKEKWITLFCLASVIFSTLPGINLIIDGKNSATSHAVRNYASKEGNELTVGKKTVVSWGMLEEFTYAAAFHDLRKFKFAIIYVPGFVFLLLLLGLFQRVGKRAWVLFVWGFLIFIFHSPYAPIYGWLYEHGVIYKFFRNLHFFLWWALTPIFVLLCVEVFRVFLEKIEHENQSKYVHFVYIFFAHLAGLIFLLRQETAILSTYLTLVFSFVLFLFLHFDFKRTKMLFWPLIFIIVAIQPIQVYSFMNQNEGTKTDNFKYDVPLAEFSYLSEEKKRSLADNVPLKRGNNKQSYHYVLKNFNQLSSAVTVRAVKNYLDYKIRIYDHVMPIKDIKSGAAKLEQMFLKENNAAIIFEKDIKEMPTTFFNRKARPKEQFIVEDADEFDLIDFTANTLKFKTNFSKERLVVYGDAFHDGWKVFVNGNQAKLFEANGAFKGVVVPEGETEIKFTFSVPGRGWLNYGLIILFYCMLGWIIFEAARIREI